MHSNSRGGSPRRLSRTSRRIGQQERGQHLTAIWRLRIRPQHILMICCGASGGRALPQGRFGAGVGFPPRHQTTHPKGRFGAGVGFPPRHQTTHPKNEVSALGRNSPRTSTNSEGCQKGSATASPMLRATEPLFSWKVIFVAVASPQGAGARRVCPILGIADAAKNIFAICRRLNRAERQA